MPDPYEFPPRGRRDDPLADIQRIFDQLRDRFAHRGPARVNPWLIVAIVLLLYALSGVFIVAPDERGIVLRFGRVVREADPGPGLPPAVADRAGAQAGGHARSARRSSASAPSDVGPPARYHDVDAEALMLTGDENIVKLQFIVQFKVRTGPTGATDFLFNVRDPQGTVRDAAEAAMREVVGRNDIDNALTEGKEQVQQDAQALLQQILDQYQIGLEVVTVKLQDVDPPDQVSDAFKDVISAQQDKERLINEARGYANDVVPKARGQAAQLLNEAEGYRAAKVQEATRRRAALHRAAGGVRQGEGRDAAAALPRDHGADPAAREQDHPRRRGGQAGGALSAARSGASSAKPAEADRAQ